MDDRVKTGIKGLDELIGGGLPRSSSILLSGEAGTGKTIFSLQYIYTGAKDYGESGIYLTFEEKPEELRKEALQFGWDLKKYEKEKKIVILDAASLRVGVPTEESFYVKSDADIRALLSKLYEIAADIDAKRIVIDSIPAFFFSEEPDKMRDDIYMLGRVLAETKATSLLITEIVNSKGYSRFGFEEFIARGVITMHLVEGEKTMPRMAEYKRSIFVRKMRETNHKIKQYPFSITKEGIVVYPQGEIY
ncbi:MAG: circadian clock protein KaiC [Candidatus Methanofastidiosum methylothiophilum]|uniref:Circadian clock protein KaiC n=1 Tax=Candidatus Methanofastidiosum methylothiophilum TaxID=1705564 RepID=A0A150IXA6_9EURY|nr:MAG: circadian clock protein KaiC [Candidatus Methanofastidiosum methylthiophilus]KYC46740.1 MAG: circadian clock protein KaiC [Candidatus Methanofastidiosum methylthiophilus]KYC49626.1 MAG: circadian clock protein KaiC [Candidatus Methanofastidiosum methylthiophilus]